MGSLSLSSPTKYLTYVCTFRNSAKISHAPCLGEHRTEVACITSNRALFRERNWHNYPLVKEELFQDCKRWPGLEMESIKKEGYILSETTEVGPVRERWCMWGRGGASLWKLERSFINRDHWSKRKSNSHHRHDDRYRFVQEQKRDPSETSSQTKENIWHIAFGGGITWLSST